MLASARLLVARRPPTFLATRHYSGKPNGNDVERNLRSWASTSSAAVRARCDSFSSQVAKTLSLLGAKMNEVTGYEEINQLKRRVVEKEREMHNLRLAAKTAKQDYDAAVTRRAVSQRIVNELLQRKSSWVDEDVGRFTQLVREDHICEQEENKAKTTMQKAEDAVETQFNSLMHAILSRYHEEQVWSDKIRSASTYGSLAVLGLNLAVFILAIVIVEPWKRDRLLQRFEGRVAQMNEQIQSSIEQGIHDLQIRQANQERALEDILIATRVSEQQPREDVLDKNTDEWTSFLKGVDQRTIVASISSAVVATAVGWLLGASFG